MSDERTRAIVDALEQLKRRDGHFTPNQYADALTTFVALMIEAVMDEHLKRDHPEQQ